MPSRHLTEPLSPGAGGSAAPRPGRAEQSGHHGRGMTLFELVMVMAIVAMVTTIAIPHYANSQTRYRVDAAAQRVMANVRFGQALAQAQSQAVVIDFDPATDRLTIPGAGPAGIDLVIQLAGPPYQADLATADFAGIPTLQFDGYGNPSSGGSVQVRVADITRTVLVDPDTGKATVQ